MSLDKLTQHNEENEIKQHVANAMNTVLVIAIANKILGEDETNELSKMVIDAIIEKTIAQSEIDEANIADCNVAKMFSSLFGDTKEKTNRIVSILKSMRAE